MHSRQPDSERVIATRSLPFQVSASVAATRELLETERAPGPDLLVCFGERLVGIVPIERQDLLSVAAYFAIAAALL